MFLLSTANLHLYTTVSSMGSCASLLSNPSAAVDAIGAKLNAFDVDAVAAPLKELLAEEKAALLDDVEYLQTCLEDEADLQEKVEAPPPPIAELREYSTKLSQLWVVEQDRAEHVQKVERMLAKPPPKGRVGKLRSLTAELSLG